MPEAYYAIVDKIGAYFRPELVTYFFKTSLFRLLLAHFNLFSPRPHRKKWEALHATLTQMQEWRRLNNPSFSVPTTCSLPFKPPISRMANRDNPAVLLVEGRVRMQSLPLCGRMRCQKSGQRQRSRKPLFQHEALTHKKTKTHIRTTRINHCKKETWPEQTNKRKHRTNCYGTIPFYSYFIVFS